LAAAQSENERLNAENKTIKSLQNEVKALQAKLATARTSAENVNSKAQASTAKNGAQVAKSDDAYTWKMKEDLYCDLTGLMVHGLKKVDGEDVFDCIQTGRNGSKSDIKHR
jgi:chromosome segregation protein Csm1/Pcs1